jgi:Mn-dependent DtxR family transcriptional regulator
MYVNESIENYLEQILIISQKKDEVKSVDLARALGVTKPSVSHATKIMRESDLIRMDSRYNITLTDRGREVAEKIYERHVTLAKALIRLGVDEEVAFTDACKIEHDISEESFAALVNHLERADEVKQAAGK